MKNKLIKFLVVISTAFITVNTFAFQNTVDKGLNKIQLSTHYDHNLGKTIKVYLVNGENCPRGTVHLTKNEADYVKYRICDQMHPSIIARLSGNGALQGNMHGCYVENY